MSPDCLEPDILNFLISDYIEYQLKPMV